MDRPRGDRFSNGPESHQYRQSRGGPINRRSPNRGGFSGGRDHRPLHSPPRFPPSGGSGFRPMGMGFNPDQQMPLSGQKRGFPFSARGGSPDNFDGSSFAKLFVGSVPKTATEDDIRPLFEEHGRVVEVALIKDKRTGQQQGCCFIKYATPEEADRAIRALHNQYTLPGGVGPIQVRYADGERERVVEYKLFVGSINKQATEKEVEEIFSPYGRVEDVYLMRDEMKQSRGCGFVKFSQREMAMAAINGLNGIFTMRGCDQPLTVRFADPKRPRPGEPRGGPAFGGPGFGPRFQPPGVRPTPNFDESTHGNIPPNPWNPMSPQNMGPSSNSGMHSFGNQLLPRSGDMALSSTPGGSFGGPSSSADGSLPGLAVSSSMSQQTSNQSSPQVPSIGQQMSPSQKPNHSQQHFPSSLQLQPQTPSYSQTQTSGPSPQQFGQPQIPNPAGQNPYSQGFPSQQFHGLSGQLPVSQPQLQQNLSSAMTRPSLNINLPSHVLSAMANQQQLPAQQQLHQSPSQLAQLLSQQTQTLQASFQSSQQAFSQLQQQLQLMQPSNQSLPAHQSSQAAKQQSPWTGMVPQAVVPAAGTDVTPATSAAPVVPVMTQAVAPVKCNWTEHTSPDGYKYYYNSTTGESKWEKPEELTLFEQHQQPQSQHPQHQQPQQQQQQQPQPQPQPQQHQHQHQHQQPQQLQHQQPQQQLQQQPQQQKPSVQQPQSQLYPQSFPTQQVPQTAQLQLQNQLQTQLHYPQQLNQTSRSSQYQAHGVSAHPNLQEHGFAQFPPQAASGTMSDPTRFQQGGQAAQEWMWKNKPAGI